LGRGCFIRVFGQETESNGLDSRFRPRPFIWIGKAKHKVDGMSFAQMAKEVIRAKKKRMCPEIMVVD